MTEKINVEGLQLRILQLEGELETIHERISQRGLKEIFETTLEVEDSDRLTGQVVATVDAWRTCLLQFRIKLSKLQKEAESEFF
ncbi:MAG TPA: hypothetical protein VEG44_04565 [Candidatus Acidoferrales bacterium]|nr:hypothetical protein [Candidatus Acidoferrales bacterium]